jgi:preprotein translocase subunit SecE
MGEVFMQWNPVVWFSDGQQFTAEVRTEFKKITWPARKEAIAGAIGVGVVVAIVTAALSLVDAVLGQFIQFILN